MLKITDFNSSILAWETMEGSVGRFKVVASLKTEGSLHPYFLAAPVLAGDVYGSGLLLRKPPYHFIWATDGFDSQIFRINSSHMLEVEQRPAETFKKIWVMQSHREACELGVEKLIAMEFESGPVLCRLNLGGQVLEFPVNHINTHKKLGTFQIETGPILACLTGSILPYFVFLNSTRGCQFVLAYPGISETICEQKCDVGFFVYA